ncbi:serine/threonine-protein kinase [Streptacidiphilus sp. MAP12-16]|uniref:serine/threonine-protein kinase n=1 Tax=Streptacidiphilus sp. MAP12-16 TaxID=3156300 RepID=UPI003516F748
MDGRFTLRERLGHGGMGTVWRAHDAVLQRDVALKEVRLLGLSDPGEATRVHERVLREARALARLQHPNVVTIHEVLDAEPFPWLVMELIAGQSLQAALEQGPLPPAQVARIGRDLLAALNAAHAAGIQHRDVKPANVLLRPDGSAVLTDFGIAAMQDLSGLTLTGSIIGSPEFMAPERATGEPGGAAADLWSLGMLLYVSVEGRSPLRRSTPLATFAAVVADTVPAPQLAGELGPVLQALLTKDPEARPDPVSLDRMLLAVQTARAQGATRSDPPLRNAAHEPDPEWLHRAPTAVVDRSRAPAERRTATAEPGATSVTRTGRRFGTGCIVAVIAATAAASVIVVLGLQSGGTPAGKQLAAASPSAPTGSSQPSSAASSAAATVSSAISSMRPSTVLRPQGENSADTWIAQLASVPISSGSGARDSELAAIRRQVPGAEVLNSDDFASLRPGYWVMYAPGPFADGEQALASCAAAGRTTAAECVGRYLSHLASDITFICRHAASGVDGNCRRGNNS